MSLFGFKNEPKTIEEKDNLTQIDINKDYMKMVDEKYDRLERKELYLDKREEELDEREEELDKREEELDKREEELADKEEELDDREAELDDKEFELDDKEMELEEREEELERAKAEIGKNESIEEYDATALIVYKKSLSNSVKRKIIHTKERIELNNIRIKNTKSELSKKYLIRQNECDYEYIKDLEKLLSQI